MTIMDTVSELVVKVDVSDENTQKALEKGFVVSPLEEPKDELPKEYGSKFYKIAQYTRNNGMNIFEIMLGLSKAEQRFITEVSYGFNFKGFVVKVPISQLPKAERSNKYRVYASLKKKGLVRRVGTDFYMINPALLIPSSLSAEHEAVRLWDLHA